MFTEEELKLIIQVFGEVNVKVKEQGPFVEIINKASRSIDELAKKPRKK